MHMLETNGEFGHGIKYFDIKINPMPKQDGDSAPDNRSLDNSQMSIDKMPMTVTLSQIVFHNT